MSRKKPTKATVAEGDYAHTRAAVSRAANDLARQGHKSFDVALSMIMTGTSGALSCGEAAMILTLRDTLSGTLAIIDEHISAMKKKAAN